MILNFGNLNKKLPALCADKADWIVVSSDGQGDLIECEEGGGETGRDTEHEEEELLVGSPLSQVGQHLQAGVYPEHYINYVAHRGINNLQRILMKFNKLKI